MTSSFLRSTRNLSSVHSGSGSGWGPLRSSSEPGRGESVLRSLLEPWSDCCKYPVKASHWAAMALRGNFSKGPLRIQAKLTKRGTTTLFWLFFFKFIPSLLGSVVQTHPGRAAEFLQAPSIGATSKNTQEEQPDPLLCPSAELTELLTATHTRRLLQESFTCQPAGGKKAEKKENTRLLPESLGALTSPKEVQYNNWSASTPRDRVIHCRSYSKKGKNLGLPLLYCQQSGEKDWLW